MGGYSTGIKERRMPNDSSKWEDVGALWLRDGKSGQYFSGSIKLPNGEKMVIVMKENMFRGSGESRPYWKLMTPPSMDPRNEEIRSQKSLPGDDIPF